MKITLDLIDALLLRGWTIRGINGEIAFRDPSGISGSDYRCRSLAWVFPEPVADWIREHVPMTASEREQSARDW